MSGKFRSIKKCPTFRKEVITFNKKGGRVIKSVEVTDNYLLTLNNGNSLVVSRKQLAQFGIGYDEIDTKTSEIVVEEPKSEEPIEEVETETEKVVETETENTGLINGSVN